MGYATAVTRSAAFHRACTVRPLQLHRCRSTTLTGIAQRNHITFKRNSHTASRGVVIGVGSNEGDRLGMIEQACRIINTYSGLRVKQTSALYETEPMYVEAQEKFLNGVIQLESSVESPEATLDALQEIEQKLKRVKTIDKGPRTIDLDILFLGDITQDSSRLTIPHPLMAEREFVLRPLSDLRNVQDIGLASTFIQRFQESLKQGLFSSQPIYSVTPLASSRAALRPMDPKRKTHVMSILNVTADSFSDGGDYASLSPPRLQETIRAQVAAGATFIDIGGQSSRPNAPDVTADEEIARVLPAIEAIKSLPEASQVIISVDTYRAVVAEAAINAGAHVINDISAGLLDAEMLPTIARLGCTYIMMHMRGKPATMQSAENLNYPDGLIRTIANELQERIDAAQAAGIRRWRIILDPGIGFSKTQEQNLEILRRLPDLRQLMGGNYPWLLGSSRKGFIGAITKVKEPKQRGWGTAATVAAAVQGGTDVVRVHDVKEMMDVVRISDAIYRS